MKVYTVEIFNNVELWKNENGELHREGGLPAYIGKDGYTAYYENNKLHRVDGPACIWPSGYEEYYIKGIQYKKKEFLKKTSPVKEMTVAEIEKALGYTVKIVK